MSTHPILQWYADLKRNLDALLADRKIAYLTPKQIEIMNKDYKMVKGLDK